MRQESRHFVQKCNFPWHQIHKYLPYNRKNYMPTHSVWKSQKKSHSALRAKRATFTFWVAKSSLKMPKMVNLAIFWKLVACSQAVLPDIFTRQKLVENAGIEKFKWDILSDFETLWCCCNNACNAGITHEIGKNPAIFILVFLPLKNSLLSDLSTQCIVFPKCKQVGIT